MARNLRETLRRHSEFDYCGASKSRLSLRFIDESCNDNDFVSNDFAEALDDFAVLCIIEFLYPRDLFNFRRVSKSCRRVVEGSAIWRRWLAHRWPTLNLEQPNLFETYRRSGWPAARVAHRNCAHTLALPTTKSARFLAIASSSCKRFVRIASSDGNIFGLVTDRLEITWQLPLPRGDTIAEAVLWDDFVCVVLNGGIDLYRLPSGGGECVLISSYTYPEPVWGLMLNKSFVGAVSGSKVFFWRWNSDPKCQTEARPHTAWEVAFDFARQGPVALHGNVAMTVSGRSVLFRELTQQGECRVLARLDLPARLLSASRGSLVGAVSFAGDMASGVAAVNIMVSDGLERLAVWPIAKPAAVQYVTVVDSAKDGEGLSVRQLEVDQSLLFVVCGLSNGSVRLVSTLSGRVFFTSCDFAPSFSTSLALADGAYLLNATNVKFVHFGGQHAFAQIASGRQALGAMFMGDEELIDPEHYFAHLRSLYARILELWVSRNVDVAAVALMRSFVSECDSARRQAGGPLPWSLSTKLERVQVAIVEAEKIISAVSRESMGFL
eukprot:TRINITY_DN7505_c0_g1_i1.p1 TRINITY_DN7505_c0_g1~~TRINITY_DN7505_c0_g1_i1.p1  ORF type:complete len:551 (-),score=84.02 TRINITY_DN7505_c0_g1_i1:744-2396(-)